MLETVPRLIFFLKMSHCIAVANLELRSQSASVSLALGVLKACATTPDLLLRMY